MAGSLTDYFENELAKYLTSQVSALNGTAPTVYVALYTVVPSDSSAGTEVTGSSYARVNASGKFGTPSAGVVSNTSNIDFPVVTTTAYTVVGAALCDASSGGNLIAWSDVASIVVGIGSFFRFDTSTNKLTLTVT